MNAMNEKPGFFRRYGVRLTALALIGGLYGFARIPTLPEGDRQALASRFAFSRLPLAAPPGGVSGMDRSIREVHPSYQDIAAWISAVGAGVALNDLDGDGLANDLCAVDPRVDQVLVSPVPGTGPRYPVFVLDPKPLAYDARTTAPMGCLPGDWNEDGRMDLVVYYWGRPPIAFLRRAAEGSPSAASYRPVEIAPGNQIWNTNALTSADVDGDGHLDLVVGNYFPDGTTTYSWTLAAGAVDLDGDLLPEIYFGNDFGNDRLLKNLSTPGRPRFAVLEGKKTFTTPASKVLGHDSFKGMGVDFADINADGILDIYVSNIAQNYALEESHFVWVSTGDLDPIKDGVAPWVDKGEDLGMSRSGWGWDARFADFDSDGVPEALQAIGFMRGEKNRWPELHELAMGNDNNMNHTAAWPNFKLGDDLSGDLHNPFFVRAKDGRYYDLAPELGLDVNHVTRAIAIADTDGDGDLDFAIANQWEPSWFLRNDAPRRNASLGLDLRLPAGPGGTRPAVGASAVVTLPDGRKLVGQADGGSGHSGKRSPEIHFGLGRLAGSTPVRVDVRWRDGAGKVRTETMTLTPGRHRVVLEDSKRLTGKVG